MHIKAHRSNQEYERFDAEMRRITDGNIMADVKQKKAIEKASTQTMILFKLVVAVLPLFDKEENERWTRRPMTTKRVRSTRMEGWHQWEDTELGKQCQACLKLHTPGQELVLTGRTGTRTFLNEYLVQPLGHCPIAVNQQGKALCTDAVPTVFVCVRCGAWAQQRRREKLRATCTQPTIKAREVVANFCRGLGPHKTLAKHIVTLVPMTVVHRRQAPVPKEKTTIVTPVATEEYSYENRMAALVGHIRAKEKRDPEEEQDHNTILGHTDTGQDKGGEVCGYGGSGTESYAGVNSAEYKVHASILNTASGTVGGLLLQHPMPGEGIGLMVVKRGTHHLRRRLREAKGHLLQRQVAEYS
ncbi:unnamed protein product, partial [Prorocentrum cordatum]